MRIFDNLPDTLRGPDLYGVLNPSSQSQLERDRVQAWAEQILRVYLNSLPSPYSSTVRGPLHVSLFEAASLSLAEMQVLAEDARDDSDFQYTRPEYVNSILGSLVGIHSDSGIVFPSELKKLEFLRRFLGHLSVSTGRGSFSDIVQLLASWYDITVRIVHRSDFIGSPDTSWSENDRNIVDVQITKCRHLAPSEYDLLGVGRHTHPLVADDTGSCVSGVSVYPEGFSGPEHTHPIESWSCQETLSHKHDLVYQVPPFEEILSNLSRVFTLGAPHNQIYNSTVLLGEDVSNHTKSEFRGFSATYRDYEDTRRDWGQIRGWSSSASILSGGYHLQDSSVDASRIPKGSSLRIPTGPGRGNYVVSSTLFFRSSDSTPRPYTTSSGQEGSCVMDDLGNILDVSQDFSSVVPGYTTISVLSGPNSGTYRIHSVVPGGVCVFRSILELGTRVRGSGSVGYEVALNRTGTESVANVSEEHPEGFSGLLRVSRPPIIRLDGTQAGPRDLVVRVGGSEVPVRFVDPLSGDVRIDPVPSGSTISVAYNTSREAGLTHSLSSLGPGLSDPRLVLTSFELDSPTEVQHTHLSFDSGSTSSLTSPDTLTFSKLSDPDRSDRVSQTAYRITYRGGEPSDSWSVTQGVGGGQSSASEGTPWLEVSGALVYSSDLPCSVGSSISLTTKIKSPDPESGEGLGLVGPVFGVMGPRGVYMAAPLRVGNTVSGVFTRHFGIYSGRGPLTSVDSWFLGPKTIGSLHRDRSLSSAIFQESETPENLSVGHRFQILRGPQTGTYTIQDVYRDSGMVSVILHEDLPEDTEGFDAGTAEVVFESIGFPANPEEASWRLSVNTSTGECHLYFGGSSGSNLSCVVGPLSQGSPLPMPIQLGESGTVFWGSLRGTSSWSLVDAISKPFPEETVSLGEVYSSPVTDPSWAGTINALSEVDTGSNPFSVRSFYRVGYGGPCGVSAVDPFLRSNTTFAVECTIQVKDTSTGHGFADIECRNTRRVARLSALSLVNPGGIGWSVWSDTSVGFCGAYPLSSQTEWSVHGGVSFENVLDSESTLVVFDSPGSLFTTLGPSSDSVSLNASLSRPESGPDIYLRFTANGRSVYLRVSNVSVSLRSSPTGPDLLTHSVNMVTGDSEFVDLRVSYDGVSLVSLLVQGAAVGIPVSVSLFNPTPLTGMSLDRFGGTTALVLRVKSLSLTANPPVGVLRTFGVLRGTDPSDINSWVLPRMDSYPVDNSSPESSYKEFDWTVPTWVRLLVDPHYGAMVYFPEYELPRALTGDFSLWSSDPMASWISVEYPNLPLYDTGSVPRGMVFVGSMNPESVGKVFWGDLSYRSYPTLDGVVRSGDRTDHHLSRVGTYGTPEALFQASPSSATVSSVDGKAILSDSGFYADRVFSVWSGGSEIDGWSFNASDQTISDLPDGPVIVYFNPSRIPTPTYLQSSVRPVTSLFSGTPPFFASDTLTTTRSVRGLDGEDDPVLTPRTDPDYFLKRDVVSVEFSSRGRIPSFEGVSEHLGSSRPFCSATDSVSFSLSGSDFTETMGPPLEGHGSYMVAGGGVFEGSGVGLLGSPETWASVSESETISGPSESDATATYYEVPLDGVLGPWHGYTEALGLLSGSQSEIPGGEPPVVLTVQGGTTLPEISSITVHPL